MGGNSQKQLVFISYQELRLLTCDEHCHDEKSSRQNKACAKRYKRIFMCLDTQVEWSRKVVLSSLSQDNISLTTIFGLTGLSLYCRTLFISQDSLGLSGLP